MGLVNAVGRGSKVLHASHNPPVPTSVSGGRYRALCGRIVRDVTTVAWRPAGPGNRCRECINESLRGDLEDED